MAKQAIKKNAQNGSGIQTQLRLRIREAALIVFTALGLILFLSLFSYSNQDPGWSFTGTGEANTIHNLGGRMGAWLADILLYLFGYLAYCFPLMVMYCGWLLFREREIQEDSYRPLYFLRAVGAIAFMVAGTGLASLHMTELQQALPVSAGGVLGNIVGLSLLNGLNLLGTSLLLLALFLTGITLLTGVSWLNIIDFTGRVTLQITKKLFVYWDGYRDQWAKRRAAKITTSAVQRPPIKKPPSNKITEPEEVLPELPKKAKIIKPKLSDKAKNGNTFKNKSSGQLPSLEILDEPVVNTSQVVSEAHLEELARLVEVKLKDFGIKAEVVSIHPGPVVTRFELQLAPGIKASKVTNLAKDLARSLMVISVRVVEVIPGKSVIGIELPNEHREIVRLKDILQAKEYQQSKSNLSLCLGKDISGFPVAVDLAKMPHLLVAGTTGSGKSVGLNAMLLSLLYKATPEQVRMILIDPKMLELSVYEGIPHLLTPVVTDMKEAANALRWCVGEMERRYQYMAALGVRNISGYNKKVQDAIDKKEPIHDPLQEAVGTEVTTLEPLPYIVVVIDELADMMMVVGKKVDQLIARIAQKARAAGIHLLLATQRPSVDVITGLIKANIPSRIAFQVSSRIDSRTILDQQGAEHLLGNGDMLYLAPGTGLPSRVHGAFVADHEVHKVVDAWKQQGQPDYLEEVLSSAGLEGGEFNPLDPSGDDGEEKDALYDQAVYIVTESRRASISLVQRKLKIGYNRAARMLEDMEKAGVVSEMQTNGTREVLAPPPPKE